MKEIQQGNLLNRRVIWSICFRILFEREASECFECNLFKIHPGVKVKSENSNTSSSLNEFGSFNNDSFIDDSDDSDYRGREQTRLKRERKKAKLKLKKEEDESSHFNCLLNDCHTSFTKEPAYVSHLLRTHPGKGLEADQHQGQLGKKHPRAVWWQWPQVNLLNGDKQSLQSVSNWSVLFIALQNW